MASKLKKPNASSQSPQLNKSAFAIYPLNRRDILAGMALQGLCANESYINEDEDRLAANAVIYADELIAQLDRIQFDG